jgi:hypothetical protein
MKEARHVRKKRGMGAQALHRLSFAFSRRRSDNKGGCAQTEAHNKK